MAVIVHEDFQFIVQGITGREALNFTRECLQYGSKIIGGVTPGSEPKAFRYNGKLFFTAEFEQIGRQLAFCTDALPDVTLEKLTERRRLSVRRRCASSPGKRGARDGAWAARVTTRTHRSLTLSASCCRKSL